MTTYAECYYSTYQISGGTLPEGRPIYLFRNDAEQGFFRPLGAQEANFRSPVRPSMLWSGFTVEAVEVAVFSVEKGTSAVIRDNLFLEFEVSCRVDPIGVTVDFERTAEPDKIHHGVFQQDLAFYEAACIRRFAQGNPFVLPTGTNMAVRVSLLNTNRWLPKTTAHPVFIRVKLHGSET